jgi:hypothetical protein
MYIIDLVLLPENFEFMLALQLVASLFVLEVLCMLVGLTLSSLDALFPDLSIDADATHAIQPHLPSNLFSFLFFGKVPFIIIVLSVISTYGLSGILIQYIYFSLYATLLPRVIINIIATLVSLLLSHVGLQYIYKLLKSSEKEAVSLADLIGLSGKIIIGHATQTVSAQAKVKDQNGHTHYVMIRSDTPQVLRMGEHITLIQQTHNYFLATIQDNND